MGEKVRHRSPAYPAYTITDCVAIVEKVFNHYGDSTFVSREQIAELLKKSENSIQLHVSACAQYGMLESKPAAGYKATELVHRFLKPLNEEEKKEAFRQCFLNPKLYESLVSRFDGMHFPSETALPNILFRDFGIANNASKRAATIFIENARIVDVIHDGKLQLTTPTNETSTFENLEPEMPEIPVKNSSSTLKTTNNNLAYDTNGVDTRSIDIPLTNRKKAILIIPDTINKRDVELIKLQIGVLQLYAEYSEDKGSVPPLTEAPS